MPVPVTPQKKSEHSPSSNSHCSSFTSGLELPSDSTADPCVVAGYEDCLRETIRFLVQEEQLPAEHPLVAGLNFHLTSDTAHQELLRVSGQLAEKLNEDWRPRVTEDEFDSGVDTSLSDEEEIPRVHAYQLTLEEDEELDGEEYDDLDEMTDDEDRMDDTVGKDDDDDDKDDTDEMDDVITAKDILCDPFLRNELIKLVFQGCDLIASPTATL